ncbi:hypothetical protein LV469_03495 [Peptoniphilus sp. GNH]|nr:hypothetical protein LV469_03495 [Peptoniphilus sp. GNH]
MRTLFKIIFAALCLIAIFIFNAFFCNPISKALANNAAKKYLNKEYKNMDFEKREIFYDFKNAAYIIRLQDKKSQDTKFDVAFDYMGRFLYDTHEDILLNTMSRFREAALEYVNEIRERENLPYELSLDLKYKDREYKNLIKLDQKVDINNFPFPLEVTANAFRENVNYEEALKILKSMVSVMDKGPFKVETYSLILLPEKYKAKNGEAQTWKNGLILFDIPKEVIERGNLDELKEIKTRGQEREKNSEN